MMLKILKVIVKNNIGIDYYIKSLLNDFIYINLKSDWIFRNSSVNVKEILLNQK